MSFLYFPKKKHLGYCHYSLYHHGANLGPLHPSNIINLQQTPDPQWQGVETLEAIHIIIFTGFTLIF